MKQIVAIAAFMLLVGCSTSMTYEEMGVAYDMAETQEEKVALEERIARFEDNAEKAQAYFERREACQAQGDLAWYCDNVQSVDMDRIKDIDGLVRAYRREHQSCGCYKSSDIQQALIGY